MDFHAGLHLLLPLVGLPLLTGMVTASPRRKAPGFELLGSEPPGWGPLRWLNSPPLRLDSLRGKVVLVHWWTDSCPDSTVTMPALNRLCHDFAGDDLVVIGMYHPKPPRPIGADALRESLGELRVEVPVAIDADWRVLRKWWLDSGDRSSTQVTFLLDRDGRIRLVHPGPRFALEGDADAVHDYKAIRTRVRKILGERGGRA